MNDQPNSTPTPEEETTVEAEAQAQAPAETTPEVQKTLPPLTAERVTDITFGLGKAAVDVLDQAMRQLDDSVRHIRQDAPGFLEEMEEKGRPVREKIVGSIKGFNLSEVLKPGAKPSATPANPGSALDDIEALESRVRELEQQVSTEPVTKEGAPESSPFSMLELDDEPLTVTDKSATPQESLADDSTTEAPKPEETEGAAEPDGSPQPKKPTVRRTKKKAADEVEAE